LVGVDRERPGVIFVAMIMIVSCRLFVLYFFTLQNCAQALVVCVDGIVSIILIATHSYLIFIQTILPFPNISEVEHRVKMAKLSTSSV
jgi:hypothetical protein